jgi:hypothetical protein
LANMLYNQLDKGIQMGDPLQVVAPSGPSDTSCSATARHGVPPAGTDHRKYSA